MLPRRHILDVCELVQDKEQRLSMATVTLAIDAVKYMDLEFKKDHLVEALELNEFICFMYPAKRPLNRSLLFHVVSDLLGLLMYGVPKKKKHTIDSIEIINYSERSMEVYPVIEVWNTLKGKVYTKKHGGQSIVDGFIQKIKIEADIMDRYPLVDEIFNQSQQKIMEWLPSFARYYDRKNKTVKNIYDKWWSVWCSPADKEKILAGMIERLSLQAESEFETTIDTDKLFTAITRDKEGNRKANELFSRWYKEGVNLLLKI